MLYKNENKCMSAKPDFIYDEACLDIISEHEAVIYEQYNDCVDCPFIQRATVNATKNISLLVNTKYKLTVEARIDTEVCKQALKFDEHARYVWNLTNGNCSNINLKTAADNAYLPILGAVIVFLCFGTLWYMVKCVYKCFHNQRYFFGYLGTQSTNELENPLNVPLVVERTPTKVNHHTTRLKSVDIFRGFCIILMIFVNYGGGKYIMFSHSVWNGLTIADLVFPWFVWLMGMSLHISIKSRLRKNMSRKQIGLQIFYRAVILILIGFILNSHGKKSDLDDLRFPGVLQRLGVVYLFVGLLEVALIDRSPRIENPRTQWAEDLLSAWAQWLVIIMMVIIHTCFVFLLPVPGCPRGYLGPGGLHDQEKYRNCTGGATGYLDRLIFGNHMYKTPTCHTMYQTTLPFDPEGLLGTFTTILTAYLGVHAACILKKHQSVFGKVLRWCIWGLITGLIAGLLCKFSKNDGVIPINKNLWSLSYALALSSMAFFIEALLYFLVDITHKWGGRPFFYPGMNSILLYIGHVVMKNTFPFAWAPDYKSHREYLAMNLWGTFLWVAISIFLYKKSIFFKI